jgi:hypothetical protein
MQAAGKQHLTAKAGIQTTVISTAVSIALMAFCGLPGACWGMVLRYILWAVFLLPPFVRTFPGVLPSLPVIRLAAGAAIMAGLLWVSSLVLITSFLTVGAAACIAITAYLGALLAFQVIQASTIAQLLARRVTE